jgi:hypothetical protein
VSFDLLPEIARLADALGVARAFDFGLARLAGSWAFVPFAEDLALTDFARFLMLSPSGSLLA